MQFSEQARKTALSVWLRTGRWPHVEAARNVEVKFNPWHDARNGRFTFAGGGGYFGAGSSQSATREDQDVPSYVGDPTQPTVSSNDEIDAWAARERAKYIGDPNRSARFKKIDQRVKELKDELAKLKPDASSTPSTDIGKPAETGGFVEGFGEGLRDAGKEAATGLYTLVTTNPVTTVRNAGLGIAGAIDAALEAEDTPAYVQFNRARSALATASPHDWGYGLGKLSGNAAIGALPGAVVARVSALRRIGRLDAAIPEGPPKIIWVDETPTFSGPAKVYAKAYNDSARGARSSILTKKGQAPALERTMPNGSKRKVKFDGVDQDPVYGDVLIDRKWSIRMNEKVKNQAIRQSEALAEHRLIAFWEVPNRYQLRQANKLLRKLGISNIKVRIVEP